MEKFVRGAGAAALLAGAMWTSDALAGCEFGGVQVGVGISASIRLGRKPAAGRTGVSGHVFGETSLACGSEWFGTTQGIELGFRSVRGAPARAHVAARVGGGVVAMYGFMGHINVVTGRVLLGASFGGGGPAVLGAGDVRGLLLHLRVAEERFVRSATAPEPTRDFLQVGLEGGFVPYGGFMVVEGRPLRDDLARTPTLTTSRPVSGLAARWLDRAADELEAVAAFLNLAAELREVGAPEDLVRRCLVAADEEADHVRRCIQRAQAHGAGIVHTAPLEHRPRRFATLQEGREILAFESLRDGWLNEGAAAAQLEADARLAGNTGKSAGHTAPPRGCLYAELVKRLLVSI